MYDKNYFEQINNNVLWAAHHGQRGWKWVNIMKFVDDV